MIINNLWHIRVIVNDLYRRDAAGPALALIPAVSTTYLEPGSGEIAGTGGFRCGGNYSGMSAGHRRLNEPVVQQRCLRSQPARRRNSGGPAQNGRIAVD